MTRLASVLTCLALAGCGAAMSQTQAVAPGSEVTLAPGETALVDARMKVRFVGVTEDSRCPRDTTCIWAGEVKAQFVINDPLAEFKVEILEGASTVAGAYRVTLVRIEPRPTSTAQIAPQDYRATLKLDNAG